MKLSNDSQGRIDLNNAYMYAIHLIYGYLPHKIVKRINDKDIGQLNWILKKDKALLDKKIGSYPPLYYAVRAGHYPVV